MTEKASEQETREVRVIRHASASKVLSAKDWHARTAAEAIYKDLDVLRSQLRLEVEQDVRAELAEAFVVAAELRTRSATEQQHALVDLSVACATRLVEGTLKVEPQRIRDIVASVLEEAMEEGPVSIVVHPASLESLQDVTTLPVRGDERLGPGDCCVEVERGLFDGRLKTRVTRLADALRSLR